MATESSMNWILLCFIAMGSCAEPTVSVFDSTLNRTGEIFHNIYDPVANRTKDIVSNATDVVNNFIQTNETQTTLEKTKNCSIVVGGALIGAVIGMLAIGLGLPLILFLLGFTCWGIMAGSAAACCQSRIGDVPAGSCFACCQGLGAGGFFTYLIIACVVGIPPGLYVGGWYTNSYFDCF